MTYQPPFHQKLRICIFSKAMSAHRGGRFLWPFTLVARQLVELGHDVTIITTANPTDAPVCVTEEGARVYYLPETTPEKTDKAYWQGSAELFEAIHAQNPFDLAMGRGRSSYGYLTWTNRPVPLISHEGTYPAWLHGYKLKRGKITDPLKWLHAIADATANRKHATCLIQSDLVIGNSHALADAISESFWWDAPPTRYIPYAFSGEAYKGQNIAREHKAGLPQPVKDFCISDAPYLVYVGRVTRKKGALDLLRVLKECSDKRVRLLLCGDANKNNTNRVTKLANELGIEDRICLAGPVPHAALPAILANAQAFVFPSTHPESLPKSVMEAMAAGLPVLGYAIPAMSELLRDGVEGFLVPPGNITKLTAAANRLLEDASLRTAMGETARQRIKADFDARQIALMWEDALHTYAGKQKHPAPTFYGFDAEQVA